MTTSNALSYGVESRGTMNSFKNNLDKHWKENPVDVTATIDALHLCLWMHNVLLASVLLEKDVMVCTTTTTTTTTTAPKISLGIVTDLNTTQN